MTCKKCGKRIKNDATLCPHCGTPQAETVSLGAINAASESRRKKHKLSTKQLVLRIVLITVAALAAVVIAGVTIMWAMLETQVQRGSELSGDLSVNEFLPPRDDVQNIALFGLDDRDSSADGHSDSIIILSIDRKHGKIKMSSIARDTLLPVSGYPSYDGKTKLTHAFSYGGVNLAVKTLNRNFGMNITDYVYVNFIEFAKIIDYIGGVTIEVEQRELNELNKHVYWMGIECGMKIDKVAKAGVQKLSGGQALAFCRIRKIDSDIERGNRQKEVLQAMFDKVKTLSVTKLPGLASKMLSICHTNLTSKEMVDIATWALGNSPEFVNYSIPNKDCQAWGGNDGGHGWVWIYDLEYATCLLHNFIYESGMDPNVSLTTTYIRTTRKTTTTKQKPTSGTTTTTAPSNWGSGGITGPDINPDNPSDSTSDPFGTGTGTDFDPTGTGTGTDFDPTGSTDPTATTPTDILPSDSTTLPSDTTTVTVPSDTTTASLDAG